MDDKSLEDIKKKLQSIEGILVVIAAMIGYALYKRLL